MKLNKKQREWIELLRSGKYRKATSALHKRNQGYCCLGVACMLFGHKPEDLYDRGSLASFPEVLKGLKLRGDSGAFYLYDEDLKKVKTRRGSKGCSSLASMNDQGWSHKEIADFIEKNPEAIFQKPPEKPKKSAAKAKH